MSYLALAPVTLISQWRIKTQGETYLNTGTSRNQEVGRRGQTAGKRVAKQLKATTRANLRGDDSNTHAQSERLLANGTSPS